MTLVDANILLDLFTNDPMWADWSEQALADAAAEGTLCINPIIYAETSIAFKHPKPLDRALAKLNIERVDLPYAAALLAGQAFLKYRRHEGQKRSPLPDFYIGAHAQVDRLTLLTRDATRYKSYFPSIKLIHPSKDA